MRGLTYTPRHAKKTYIKKEEFFSVIQFSAVNKKISKLRPESGPTDHVMPPPKQKEKQKNMHQKHINTLSITNSRMFYQFC